jgi:hypothetical protein
MKKDIPGEYLAAGWFFGSIVGLIAGWVIWG